MKAFDDLVRHVTLMVLLAVCLVPRAENATAQRIRKERKTVQSSPSVTRHLDSQQPDLYRMNASIPPNQTKTVTFEESGGLRDEMQSLAPANKREMKHDSERPPLPTNGFELAESGKRDSAVSMAARGNPSVDVDSADDADKSPSLDARLNFGAAEAADCFGQTRLTDKVTELGSGDIPYPVKVKRFYKELSGRRGSVRVFVDRIDQALHNMRNKSGWCNFFEEPGQSEYCCAVSLRAPEGTYAAVEVTELVAARIQLYDAKSTRVLHREFNVSQNSAASAMLFLSTVNVVSIIFSLTPYRLFPHALTFQFYARKSRPHLEVLRYDVNRGKIFPYTMASEDFCVSCMEFTAGVVRTPVYRELSFLLTPLPDPWALVTGRPSQVIMTSFPDYHLMTQCVRLHDNDSNNERLAIICPYAHLSNRSPLATIYNTSRVYVYVDSLLETLEHHAGFRLLFSFHNKFAQPVKFAGIPLWNCSSQPDYRSELLHHLSCNMEMECHDAADESSCSYTSELCGAGYVTLGGGCFFYVRRRKQTMSWDEASQLCSNHVAGGPTGGRVATLNTEDKWRGFIKMIRVSRYRVSDVFVGLKSLPNHVPLWYKWTYQWTDGTPAFQLFTDFHIFKSKSCSYLHVDTVAYDNFRYAIFNILCSVDHRIDVLCEKPFPFRPAPRPISFNNTARWSRDTMYIECRLGHYTHKFLACDEKSSCWSSDECESSNMSAPASFMCANRVERVPYPLVCDHRADCSDDSDEDFCDFPPCLRGQFSCNKQCIPETKLCDVWIDCHNGEDENDCDDTLAQRAKTIPPPGVLFLENPPFEVMALGPGKEGACPQTHFKCADNGYCLPILLRCNGVYDCQGHEDETACDVCPGLYRCRGSQVCLHQQNLCDGLPQCPQFDDEMMCDSACPDACVCRDFSFFCGNNTFTALGHPHMRFFDASGSGITFAQLTGKQLLIHVIMARCGMSRLEGLSLPNLLFLDIHDNNVSTVSQEDLSGVPQLREFVVAGNPLAFFFDGLQGSTFPHVTKLDVSRVVMHDMNVTALSVFPNLRVLNLSYSWVHRMHGEGFRIVQQLRVIDIRGCPLTQFPRGIFHGLENLQTVYAFSFRMCCPALLPVDFNLRNCLAPSNDLSSCTGLLRTNGYSASVFVLSIFAIGGNCASFFFRTYVSKKENKLGYGTFVMHLSVSDFLMGVYLFIIGVANQVFRGTYLWNDVHWRTSLTCKTAGFLSLLSSEVSVLIICLITLDRFLVLRFPFSRLRFSSTSAHIASVVVWIVGVVLAAFPLLPMTSHWEFYSQTGICIPLPFTKSDFAGYDYSFNILILMNFVVFGFISLGQLSIYWSIRANSMSVSCSTKKTKDLDIARRLISVAVTDFLCWFPIGVLGLMASSGATISGEVNVATAIFVLPFNSAVNPCLYTLNVILERRRRARDEKLRTVLIAQLKREV